jgi:ketosteroid isomerase-like protein
MKNCILLLLLIVSTKVASAQEADIKKLKELNEKWIASFVTRDTATMRSIYADDMELVSPGGEIFHKKDLLKNLLSLNQEFVSSKVDSVRVRIFNNIGLVNATSTAHGKAAQKEFTVTTCYLDVYEKRNGRWYAVASQVTVPDNQ